MQPGFLKPFECRLGLKLERVRVLVDHLSGRQQLARRTDAKARADGERAEGQETNIVHGRRNDG